MNFLTADFETYYTPQFSLTRLTTEEYIRHEMFEVIGVAVQVDDGKPEWFSGTRGEIKNWLCRFPWDTSALIAHNAMFDAAILSWVFDLHPKYIFDTLSMARAKHGVEVRGRLADLAEFYKLGAKGREVELAKGKRRADFHPADLAQYGAYCCNDVALTYALFCEMMETYPKKELQLINQTIKMFSEPVLELDMFLLEKHLSDVLARKEELLAKLGGDPMEAKKNIMSNPKFAELLRSMGVEPPTKISPTTGKQTYAFAKTDEGMRALLEHENPDVQALASARMGVKSTLEETRTTRFIEIARRGKLPIPLKYYAAHPGRWGGTDKINMQNLPSRGKDAGALKQAIRPPEGHVIIDCDSSQIEARILAWLAGQDDLVEAFRTGQDVYKIMASAIYHKPIEEITPAERFVGKSTVLGCLAAGAMVLCWRGWTPIEQVRGDDLVWDGEEWVCHSGLVPSGLKETVNLCGLWLTPDHQILSGTQWLEAHTLVRDEGTLCRALEAGAGNLPFQAMHWAYAGGSEQSLSGVIAGAVRTCVTSGASKTLKKQSQTYDLAYAGPRNRYTVLTDRGPVIVHNCGYGMGAKKFRTFMQIAGVEMSHDEATHIIETYRRTYPRIPALWAQGDVALRALVDNRSAPYGRDGVVQVNGFLGVLTPNGIPLRYMDLRRTRKPTGEEALVYTSRAGITSIYGAKFTENIIQHLARCVVGDQLLMIAKRYRVVLTVHDAVACIARKEEAEEARAYVESCMRWVPSWGAGMPLNCESGMGDNYGEC